MRKPIILLVTVIAGTLVVAQCSKEWKPPTCEQGEVICADHCVDPETDPEHCGTCYNACGEGELCSEGFCRAACEEGMSVCGGGCYDLDSDHEHCGSCENACAEDEVCDGGSCTSECPAGEEICNGGCHDTATSRMHCGTCNHTCAPGEVCVDGVCRASCPPGQQDCGGICVDTSVHPEHCGTCGAPCEPGEICDGSGSCALTCQAGLVECDGTCIDPDTDERYCGASDPCSSSPGTECDEGEICDGSGSCALTCQAGLVECDGTCIDPFTDERYCGASDPCSSSPGTECADGEVCNGSGVCALSCQSGLIVCDGTCIDPLTDERYCGAAAPCSTIPGEVCGAGHVCDGAGSCALSCQSGLIVCDGTCIDPLTDERYCGAADPCSSTPGDTCDAGESCSSGSCLPSCGAGLTNCSGECVDMTHDPDHCGSCTNACGTRTNATTACVSSSCRYFCNDPYFDCNADMTTDGCEVSLESDSNCGMCGIDCGSTGICLSRSCSSGRWVFLTSTTVTGSMGGMSGADATCQARATAAGMTGTYKAWLTDSTTTVSSRLAHSTVPYYKLNGVKVADNWTDLMDGSIDSAINVNELGATVGTGSVNFVYTGADASGNPAAYDCSDWTDTVHDGSLRPAGGDWAHVDSQWAWCWNSFCDTVGRLYCFQQ